MDLTLPAALEPFRQQFLETQAPFIRVKVGSERPTAPWESKVGGIPYLPAGADIPVGADGKELFFLAQVNCADLPMLDPLPAKGILSFFISDDDLYGMNFEDETCPENFKVVYFPEIVEDLSALRTTFPLDRDYELLPHHPERSFPLSFGIDKEIVPVTDYRFWEYFGHDFFQKFGAEEWQMLEAYNEAVNAQGHKMGGYAYFTQDDPRDPDDPMLLLLQLDSDEQMNLMWGDTGVGHFFIREKDLRERDFSQVWYDWDGM